MVCELVLVVPGCAGVFAVVESQSKISLRDDTVSTCGPSDLQTAYSGEGSHDASPLILSGRLLKEFQTHRGLDGMGSPPIDLP